MACRPRSTGTDRRRASTWADEDALPFPLCLSAGRDATAARRASASRAATSSLADHGLTRRRERARARPAGRVPHSGRLTAPEARARRRDRVRVPYERRRRRCDAAGRDGEPCRPATAPMPGRRAAPATATRLDARAATCSAATGSTRDFVVEMEDDGARDAALRRRRARSPAVSRAARIRRDVPRRQRRGGQRRRRAPSPRVVSHARDGDRARPQPAAGARRRRPGAARAGRGCTPARRSGPRSARSPRPTTRRSPSAIPRCSAPPRRALDRQLVHGVRHRRPARRRGRSTRPSRPTCAASSSGSGWPGYDLEIDAPRFVPLDIALHVCVEAGLLPSRRRARAPRALRQRDLPGGRRGFFHPDNFTFGQPVYLSRDRRRGDGGRGRRLVDVTTRSASRAGSGAGGEPAGEIAAGRIAMHRLEIARLDNDPSLPRTAGSTSRWRVDDERHATTTRLDTGLDACGCCGGRDAPTPDAAAQPARPRRARLPRRHAAGFLAPDAGARSLGRRARTARTRERPLAALTARRRTTRPIALLDAWAPRRRRAHLLPGADRQRGLPAHGDRAALGARARPRDRLRAAAGRRGEHVPRFHDGRPPARRQRHGPGRDPGPERPGRG